MAISLFGDKFAPTNYVDDAIPEILQQFDVNGIQYEFQAYKRRDGGLDCVLYCGRGDLLAFSLQPEREVDKLEE